MSNVHNDTPRSDVRRTLAEPAGVLTVTSTSARDGLIEAIGTYAIELGDRISEAQALFDAGDRAAAAAAVKCIEADLGEVGRAVAPAAADKIVRDRIDEGLFHAIAELVPGYDELVDRLAAARWSGEDNAEVSA